MLHLKSYVGSIVLASLLLQGCGSDSSSVQVAPSTTVSEESTASLQEAQARLDLTTSAIANASAKDNAQAQSDLTLKFAALDATNDEMKAFVDQTIAKNSDITTRGEAYRAMVTALTASTSAQNAPQRLALFDSIKEDLVGLLDSDLGNTITAATFDVVLNSEGVTVVMLDAARGSHTITRIMIDALDADWSLTAKMVPMLQENQEFGEKFLALAYEEPQMARFFFSRVDATMYDALTDAMLLSDANPETRDDTVEYSVTGYMGVLMNMYSKEYFVAQNSGANKITRTETVDGVEEEVKYSKLDAEGNLATDDNFVNLLFNTGAIATYNSATQTFTAHGDGNELTNEKFFYALFKTSASTNSFIDAMDQIPVARVALMDNIFMGTQKEQTDTLQGSMNIIAIGSAMYDGIYGTKNIDSVRVHAEGLGAYTGAFIGFAGLIPFDRFVPYGKAFIDAGYKYAEFQGSAIPDLVATAWDYVNSDDNTTTLSAPSRSGMHGIIYSDWTGDVTDLTVSAISNGKTYLTDVALAAYSDFDFSDFNVSALSTQAVNELKNASDIALATFMDGNAETGLYTTELATGESVAGIHGLLELAVREDMVNTGLSTDITEAEGNFTLPAFADITMEFAYNTASRNARAYYNDNVDAEWFADLSSNELVREYFYPDANNTYIPSSLLAIDWLKVPANYENASYEDYAFDFNAGYVDVYVVSTNVNLMNEIDLPTAVDPLKTITMEAVDMSSDSIIAVDEDGLTMDGLYVYKIRVISPADVEAVLATFTDYGDTVSALLGLDSSNAEDVATEPIAE